MARSIKPSGLLEISPYRADEGEPVGKIPSEVPSDFLSRYYGAKNPLMAIREKCLDCCCGSPSEVRKCVATDCALWPFRIGINPFRQKRTLSAEQKKIMADRLAKAKGEAIPLQRRANG